MSPKQRIMAAAGLGLRALLPEQALGRLCDRVALRAALPPLRANRVPKFQILVYHRVLPAADPFGIGAVTSDVFRGHMAALRRCFRVISLDRLLEELAGGGPGPGAVCITFDDGYMDNYRHALPILEEYGLPWTVFLATDFIGTGRQPWYESAMDAIKYSRAARLNLEGAPGFSLDLPEGPARAEAGHALLKWLKAFAPAERDALIDRVRKELRAERPGEAEGRMLGWEEVAAMARKGVAFGAHTRTHPIVTRIPLAAAETEIAGSKRDIEARLDRPVRLFAYPNGQAGDFDDATMALVRKLGFACAVTTVAGVNTPARDRFALLRDQPWEPDPNAFLFRLGAARLSA